MKNRWKNKAMWVALASAVLLALQAAGVPVVAEEYTEIVNTVLTVLTLAGVLSDPTTPGFFDDKNVGQ